MQEASEVLLRSVKHLYEPRYRDYHLLNDVRANLSDQLDRCNDKVGVTSSGCGFVYCYVIKGHC